MTHAINSKTNLQSIDITRTCTQMRKSPRGEKESGKEMRRDSGKNKKRKKIKENLRRKKERRRKKSINKLKINKIKMKKK